MDSMEVLDDQVGGDNIRENEEEAKAEVEKEKESIEKNPVGRQVVQNDGAMQLGGGGVNQAKSAINQAVAGQNVAAQKGASKIKGVLGLLKNAVHYESLPEKYKKLGTLLEEYSSLENSDEAVDVQKNNALKAKLQEIFVLTREYLFDDSITDQSQGMAILAIKGRAQEAIAMCNRREKALLQKEQQNKEEKENDQAQLDKGVENPQAEGTGNIRVRSEIRQTLESTGKYGNEKDDDNYTAMKEGIKKLDTQLNEPVTKKNMLVSWRELKKTYAWIASAAHQYVSTHKTAVSPSGKTRRRNARALLNLCKSDVIRLTMAIQRSDPTEQQATWQQLLEKKSAGENSSKLTVKGLMENKYTDATLHDIVMTAGFRILTKEQFLVMNGLSVDQIPQKYRDIVSLLDEYYEKLTLDPTGKMRENDDSQATLVQIQSLAKQFLADKMKNQVSLPDGKEQAINKLTFTMRKLEQQCGIILESPQSAPVSSPADRLHGPVPMPGKVDEKKELDELLSDTSKKEEPVAKEQEVKGPVVKEPEDKEPVDKEPEVKEPVIKEVVQEEKSEKEQKDEIKDAVAQQSVQNSDVPQGQVLQTTKKKKGGGFSKEGLLEFSGKNLVNLPEDYQPIGDLVDEYNKNIKKGEAESEQGRAKLIKNLNKIQNMTEKFLKKERKQRKGKYKSEYPAIGMLQFRAAQMKKSLQKGEFVSNDKKQEAPPNGAASVKIPGMKQQLDKTEKEKPEQKPENTQAVKPEQQSENIQKESASDKAKQQGESQNENSQQQQAKEKPAGPAGPSMREEFIKMMKVAVETGGKAVNSDYKELIKLLETVNAALGDTITKDNQADSWKKLLKAYEKLAGGAEWYAKAYTDTPTAVGRVCRRHARMLLLMCKFDIHALQIANKDEKLAEKNTTWKQILEQPAGAAASQQNASQQNASQDVDQKNQIWKGEAAKDFRNWKSKLEASEKGGIGKKNSKYFNRVLNALEDTAKVMDHGFSKTSKNNFKILSDAASALRVLQTACQEYTARNPRSKRGIIRRNIVLQIQKYAAQDAIGCQKSISDFIGKKPEEQARETWVSVLGKARSVQLTVDDFSKLKAPGSGQASDVVMLPFEEGEQSTTKYFKKEDSINMDVVKEKGKDAPPYLALQETLKKYPKLSKEDQELFKELNDKSTPNEISKKKFTEKGASAANYYVRRWSQLKTTIESLMGPLGIVDESGNIANMSRRNVATSRIAELLGLGNLVAKSQTVDILDKATGQTIRGNLMDQAKGKGYDDVHDAFVDNQITSGFVRDAANLQVLDMLCGQVDRHAGNMMYITEKQNDVEVVTGIQGIDNDGAFGTNTDVLSAKDSSRKDLRVFDPKTFEMIIPYMDDEVAERIKNLDRGVVQYVLKDLLTKEEIQATLERLDILKTGIMKAQSDDEGKKRFLKTEKEWTIGLKDPKEKDSKEESVEENFLNSHKNFDTTGLITSYDKTDKVKLLKEKAEEMFAGDQETVAAIVLCEENPKQFDEKYQDRTQWREFKNARDTVYRAVAQELKSKYLANRNYFGRIMYNDGVPYIKKTVPPVKK
ncbi:MAG: hypothetical protein SO019_09935 [Lachnospiraceae bacterium]|nr:hypothetical protein [Lachnospiraceae bacterium]